MKCPHCTKPMPNDRCIPCGTNIPGGEGPGSSLRITETVMSSTVTVHLATANKAETGWFVTWLGDRLLTGDQAVTALVVAERVAAGVSNANHRQWPQLQAWAAELELTADNAVYLVKEKT